MNVQPNDMVESAFLSLTIVYYLHHFWHEMRRVWRHARQRLEESRVARNSLRALIMIAALLGPSGCMQSGPAMLYMLHLGAILRGEAAAPGAHGPA